MKQLHISKAESGQRFDKYLAKLFPQATMGFLYKMVRKKNITLNGKKATGKELLSEDDQIQVFFSDDTFDKFAAKTQTGDASSKKGTAGKRITAEPGFFGCLDEQILFQNEHLLLVNKPSGVLSQKASPLDVSVNEWALSRIPSLTGFKPSVLNRLDRNTSGILCVSRSMEGARVISEALQDRTLEKYYRTFVFGHNVPEGILQAKLSKDHTKNQVRIGSEGDTLIETGVSVVLSGYIKQIPVSYLEIHLLTGKSHQIRAHLASIGHPIIGDRKYGNDRVNQIMGAEFGIKYQMLHAYRLTAPEQIFGGFTVTAPLPESFEKLLEAVI